MIGDPTQTAMGTFPVIPGVEFRIVPGFPEYAVSNDGRVWNGRGRKWQVVETFPIETGEAAVFLQKYATVPHGGTRFTVAELVAVAFPAAVDEDVE